MGKYHKGDLCRIWSIYDFTEMSYPNPPRGDEWKLGLIVRILGNYNEVCQDKAMFDCTTIYSVEVPPEYSPQCYNDKGEWDFGHMWMATNCFGWSWVAEENLELVSRGD